MSSLCQKCNARPMDRVVVDYDEPEHELASDLELLPPGPPAIFAVCGECDDGGWHEVELLDAELREDEERVRWAEEWGREERRRRQAAETFHAAQAELLEEVPA